MGVKKGQNNFKEHQLNKMKDTVTAIKNSLVKYRKTNTIFNSKTHLSKILADEVGISSKHLLKYYSQYLVEYIVSQSGDAVDLISDESASSEILRAKLRKEKLRRSNAEASLKRCEELFDGRAEKKSNNKYEVAFDSTAKILYELIARLKGTVVCENGIILDHAPLYGYSDVVADKELSKYYLEWLKHHPIYGDQHG